MLIDSYRNYVAKNKKLHKELAALREDKRKAQDDEVKSEIQGKIFAKLEEITANDEEHSFLFPTF